MTDVYSMTCYIYASLGSRPPPFRTRLNYAHAYAANIRRMWKAWAETSRDARNGGGLEPRLYICIMWIEWFISISSHDIRYHTCYITTP